jgi:hypothetical protein
MLKKVEKKTIVEPYQKLPIARSLKSAPGSEKYFSIGSTDGLSAMNGSSEELPITSVCILSCTCAQAY